MEPTEYKQVSHRFRSRLEMAAFEAGVEWVNDGALELIAAGQDADGWIVVECAGDHETTNVELPLAL